MNGSGDSEYQATVLLSSNEPLDVDKLARVIENGTAREAVAEAVSQDVSLAVKPRLAGAQRTQAVVTISSSKPLDFAKLSDAIEFSSALEAIATGMNQNIAAGLERQMTDPPQAHKATSVEQAPPKESLRRLVDYLWDHERKHYLEAGEENPGHIFNVLQDVQSWLSDTPVASAKPDVPAERPDKTPPLQASPDRQTTPDLPGEVDLSGGLIFGPQCHCRVEVREVAHNGRGVARLKSFFSTVNGSGVRDAQPLGEFFDGVGLPVNTRELAHRWGGDRHHLRVEIELPFVENPAGLTRRVMEFAQTHFMPTEGWAAAPVHQFSGEDVTNVFVACRGQDRNGEPFTVEPEVAAIQLRDAFAKELLSELGPRTKEQIDQEMVAEAHRKAVTGHDHVIAGKGKVSGSRLRIDERDLTAGPGSVRQREHLVARLEWLKEHGFARKTGRIIGPRGWDVRADFRRGLQELAERQIIATQVSDKPELLDALHGAKTPRHVEGILAGKGPLNPLTGEHWVIVRRNDEHYLAKTWVSNGLDQSELGSAVSLGRESGPRLDAAESILAYVQKSNASEYSGAAHSEMLAKSRLSPEEWRGVVERAVAFAERASGDQWSGITKQRKGFAVEGEKLERYVAGRSGHPDFRPLSYYNVERAVERQSYTYLDRQQTRADLTKALKDSDIVRERDVARLMQERGSYLELHGYGSREGGAVRLNRGARGVLARHEATAWAAKLGERNGKEAKFVALQNGETLTGKYFGRGRIHSGVAAVIENPDKSLSVVLLAVDPGAPKKRDHIKITGGRDVFATAQLVAIKPTALKKSVGGLSL